MELTQLESLQEIFVRGLDNLGKLPRRIISWAHMASATNGATRTWASDNLPSSVESFANQSCLWASASDNVLMVRADVRGFLLEEINLRVEPRRLTITGTRENAEHRTVDEVIYLDPCPDLMVRILDLPVKIDHKKAKAVLRNGILEVSLPKKHSRP